MEKKTHNVPIDPNAIEEAGDGKLSFSRPVTISDDTPHWNGRKYDVKSMDLSKFDGKLRSDHWYGWEDILGKVHGLAVKGKKLVIDGLEFAVGQSAKARFAYDMVTAGFVTDLSIGSLGGEEDDDGLIRNATLMELSLVGLGNNPSAKINEVARNSIEQSEAAGLDTAGLRKTLEANNLLAQPTKEEQSDMDPKEIEELQAKNAALTEANEKLTGELDSLKNQIEDEKDEKAKEELQTSLNSIKEMVEAQAATIEENNATLKDAFDKAAKAPEFKKNDGGAPAVGSKNEFESLDPKEAIGLQLQSFLKAERHKDMDAATKLHKLNEFHLNRLKEEKIVPNSVTLADFGNFVVNPELITEIQGQRSDFSDFLALFPFQETNSLRMAWLERSGDIDMTHVKIDSSTGADANLKPISDYGATQRTSDLEELAAVTVLSVNTDPFLAADLMADIAQGYRTDFDRKRAQLVAARLEQAIETDADQSFGWTASGVDTPAERLDQIRKAVYAISQGDGVLVMNEATFGILWGQLTELGAGGALTDTIVNGSRFTALWGKRIAIAPNELLPTLGDTGTYKTIPVGDYDTSPSNVVLNHAIYYVDAGRNWRGRTNGGLRYDLSTEAAYEENGTVKSLWQRNEVGVRGSMFRGGQILDRSRVTGVRVADVIS